jgi:hypothetical protein
MSIKLEKAKGTTEAKHDRPGIPTIELLPIRRLRPNKDNARTHPKKQIRQLADSIRRYGWIDGILIDERGNIIAGHGRYEAALKLGEDRVPVTVVSGLNDVERRALALAHNKIPANAGWDRKRLGAELADLGPLLPELQLDLDITGFEPAEIDALLGELIDSESDLADVVPVIGCCAAMRRLRIMFNISWALGGPEWPSPIHPTICLPGTFKDAAESSTARLFRGQVSCPKSNSNSFCNLAFRLQASFRSTARSILFFMDWRQGDPLRTEQ